MNIKIVSEEQFDKKRAAIVKVGHKYVFPDRPCTIAEKVHEEQQEFRSLLDLVSDIDLAGNASIEDCEELISFFDAPATENAKGGKENGGRS